MRGKDIKKNPEYVDGSHLEDGYHNVATSFREIREVLGKLRMGDVERRAIGRKLDDYQTKYFLGGKKKDYGGNPWGSGKEDEETLDEEFKELSFV